MNYYCAICVIHVANSTLLFLLVVALMAPRRYHSADAILCYSCSGTCLASQHCNCQTGSCEGNYCYTDLLPSGDDMKLNKGCTKKAPQEDATCFLMGDNRHIRCYCKDQFCNSEYPKVNEDENKNALTCQQCSIGESKCTDTCSGDYCRKEKISKFLKNLSIKFR